MIYWRNVKFFLTVCKFHFSYGCKTNEFKLSLIHYIYWYIKLHVWMIQILLEKLPYKLTGLHWYCLKMIKHIVVQVLCSPASTSLNRYHLRLNNHGKLNTVESFYSWGQCLWVANNFLVHGDVIFLVVGFIS